MMRTLVPVALFLVPQLSTAQTPSQPTLLLTAYLGVASGHALWNVDRQPVCQLAGGPPIFTCSGQTDTMGLTRDVSSSIGAGLAIAYFPARVVGLEVDINYLGLPFDTNCRAIKVTDSKNQELCNTITASSLSSSSISFDFGVIARAVPGGFSPYARAGIGILASSGSSVEVVGSFTQGSTVYSRSVIVDDHPRRGSAAFTVGGGVMAALGPGYVFRLEVKDVYASLARIVGPANDLGVAPTSTRAYHHITLTMGLGIVLERKRSRRY
jgi:opacity protein-like surface antigen